MSGTSPVFKNAAVSARSQQYSENTEDFYHASQLKEYYLIRKLLKFVRVDDALNTSIWKILKVLVEKKPSIEGMEYAIADISDMSIELPEIESVLEPKFVSRPALIFRLFRQTIEIHHINSIFKDKMDAVQGPDADVKKPSFAGAYMGPSLSLGLSVSGKWLLEWVRTKYYIIIASAS